MRSSLLLLFLPLLLLGGGASIVWNEWQRLDQALARVDRLAALSHHLSQRDEREMVNPNYVTDVIETQPLMVEKRKAIAALAAHPAFASWQEGYPDHLVFDAQGNNPIEWKQRSPVYVTTDELTALLSHIEGVAINGHTPAPHRPNLSITSFTLDKEEEWKLSLTLMQGVGS